MPGIPAMEYPMPLKLFACPFCDAKPRLIGPVLVAVECEACGARGPRGMDIPDAVDKWNRCRSVEEVKSREIANAERL